MAHIENQIFLINFWICPSLRFSPFRQIAVYSGRDENISKNGRWQHLQHGRSTSEVDRQPDWGFPLVETGVFHWSTSTSGKPQSGRRQPWKLQSVLRFSSGQCRPDWGFQLVDVDDRSFLTVDLRQTFSSRPFIHGIACGILIIICKNYFHCTNVFISFSH